MAYTIAQTAGKRANSGSQNLMPTDSDHAAPGDRRPEDGHTMPVVKIVSSLHNDARLVAGAGVIAFHTAQQAGLAEAAQEHLSSATTQACEEVFALANADPKSLAELNLTASRFSDRIEIAIELSDAPAQAHTHSKNAHEHDGRHGGKVLDEGLVDRVERETRNGRPAIVLVKYYRPVKSKA
jgi:hypothetical protein